jgi:phage/plasmid-like protein (TIGR03299 family)
MAHEISIQNGRAELAYVGETPWHTLGTKVDHYQTAAAMLKVAGLEWTVERHDVMIDGEVIAGYRGLVRSDTRHVLGVVTDRYVPIQNVQAADVADALILEGGAHVEVAGALSNGARCWLLAQVPGDFEVVKGDSVKPYFLLAWGHDGKHGLAGKLTPIRVVCNNTLAAAGLAGGKWSTSADVYVRHNANAKIRIEDARHALGVLRKQTEETAAMYRALAAVPVSAPGEYFKAVYPAPVAPVEGAYAVNVTDAYAAKLDRWNEHQARLLELFESGKGTEVPGVRGTVWGAYNAVAEWADHVYPVLQSGDVSRTRQQGVLFGSGADVKARALTEALAEAQARA